jgi:uncharacterized SAM-binding protein YcdF (DUF218 family)
VALPRRTKTAIYVLLGLGIVFVAATIRLFMLPARNSPRHVDAIVVLGGTGHRLETGVRLVREGYAENLIVSTPGQGCPDPIPNVHITCFVPSPSTTQGEARHTAALAKQYGWKSLIVITTTAQTTRARVRFKRCTNVDIAYVTTATRLGDWPRSIAYEWAALVKAEIFQRGC